MSKQNILSECLVFVILALSSYEINLHVDSGDEYLCNEKQSKIILYKK